MNTEPELEDLSAYLDKELTGTARQELEAHLQTCETCRRRLAALRQTVSAVQALPTEAPPRVFTIPPQRQQRRVATGWAWAGGALAAACLQLLADPARRRQMGETARRAVFPRYDLSTLLATMDCFYTSLAGRLVGDTETTLFPGPFC